MRKKVLIVDDSAYMRSVIKSALVKEGYEVVGEAEDGETAIDLALDLNPDLITLDNILPDMIGLEIIKVLHEEQLTSKVIMVSAVGQQTMLNRGIELGAAAYLLKPFTSESLIETVNNALVSVN
ncbi:MAG: response regulator [Cyclobacteriaceae bacterium]|nr:response regulator [Cyclobacteriaceae bacterium SS2]